MWDPSHATRPAYSICFITDLQRLCNDIHQFPCWRGNMYAGHTARDLIKLLINILITETNNERYVNWPHANATHVHTGLSKTVYSHMGEKTNKSEAAQGQ